MMKSKSFLDEGDDDDIAVNSKKNYRKTKYVL
jgi:hypothetical protein